MVGFRQVENHDRTANVMFLVTTLLSKIKNILPKEDIRCVVWVKLVSGCTKTAHKKQCC